MGHHPGIVNTAVEAASESTNLMPIWMIIGVIVLSITVWLYLAVKNDNKK